MDTKKGLNWYDYGARNYDAAIGRFMTVDPMAEKYYEITPYAYCYNNSMKYFDPDGKDGVIAIKGNSIVLKSNIILVGKNATSKLAGIYKAGIMNSWGKTTSYDFEGVSYKVSWNINVRAATKDEVQDYNGVNNYLEVANNEESSFIENSNKGRIRSKGRYGLDIRDNNPMPHEFGHIFGLKDKYFTDKNDPRYGSAVSEEWKGNIMAEPAGKGKVEKKNLDLLFKKAINRYNQFIKLNRNIDIPWEKEININCYINRKNREE